MHTDTRVPTHTKDTQPHTHTHTHKYARTHARTTFSRLKVNKNLLQTFKPNVKQQWE